MHWYFDVLKKYVVFGGRARRQEFWVYTLIDVAITIALVVVGHRTGSTVPSSVYALITTVPTIAVTVRRLHDTDHSAWFLLWLLVPLVGGIVLLVHLCADTTQGRNQFGLSPKLVPAHL
ncbi:DUF805 domain-containing protein [Streptomyces sp. CBMA29]|uniref:DUF805 domain-containing protein n=1 Tax=Streptomyces sp. CBMA29 TaxID=1896314 RepID=UPI001661AC1F|nr:DUF805 domain-containing protein [Streptomyces sp. CBMA29]MBD0734930.1 hypothetical protein [Streptomyces sp. CBMA29]